MKARHFPNRERDCLNGGDKVKIVRALISVLLVTTVLTTGCASGQLPVPTHHEFAIPSAAGGEISDPKFIMAGCHKPEEVFTSLNAPYYILPLDLTGITNSGEIESAIRLNKDQKQFLKNNGFAVIPWHGDYIVQPYKAPIRH